MTTNTASPSTTALVLLDMQESNLSRLENSEELIANAASLLSSCRSHGLTIAHVRVAFEEEDYQRLSPHNKAFSYLRTAGSAMKQGIHASLPAMQFHQSFTPLPGEIIVRKTRIGAFSNTDLHAQLQKREVNTLLFVGLATSGAVLSTARDGCDKDYAMTVVSDACADRSLQVHQFLLEQILPKTCEIQTTNEVLSKLQ